MWQILFYINVTYVTKYNVRGRHAVYTLILFHRTLHGTSIMTVKHNTILIFMTKYAVFNCQYYKPVNTFVNQHYVLSLAVVCLHFGDRVLPRTHYLNIILYTSLAGQNGSIILPFQH